MGKIINISDKLNKSTDKQVVKAAEYEAQVIDNEAAQQSNAEKGKIIEKHYNVFFNILNATYYR